MTTAQWLGLAIKASIVLTVLGLGLTATWSDATFLFRRPALLFRAVLSMSVVMPIVAALIATTFDLPFEVKAALVALAVSPVPPTLQKKQIASGGRREYVVGLLVAMSVFAIAIVPLTVVIVDKVFERSASLAPAAVAKIMLMTVFAPLIAGVLIRHWMPAAEKASRAIMAIAGLLLVVGVVILLYGLWPITRSFLGNGVALMLAVLAVIGLAVGHFLGGPRAGDRTTLAMATASRHPALALAAATSGPLTEAKPELAIILLYLIIATIVSIPYEKWRERSTAANSRNARNETENGS